MTRISLLLFVASFAFAACSNQRSPETSDKTETQSAAKAEKPSRGEQEKSGGLLKKILGGPETLTVPAGTSLPIRLAQSLSTEKNTAGDKFQATLDHDLVVDGKVVAPAGSTISGTITEAKRSGKVKGRAEMSLTLTGLVAGGKTYPIRTNSWFSRAPATKKKDAAWIGGGAGAGALIGAIAGGKKGAAIGAAVGGGAGTTEVLLTRGKEVRLPAETRLTFRLQESIQLPVQQK